MKDDARSATAVASSLSSPIASRSKLTGHVDDGVRSCGGEAVIVSVVAVSAGVDESAGVEVTWVWTRGAVSKELPPHRGDKGCVTVRLVGLGEAEEGEEGRGKEESEAIDTLREGGEEGDEGGLTCLKLSGSLE